jgi:O-antigen/teichoic acid export membrane protein
MPLPTQQTKVDLSPGERQRRAFASHLTTTAAAQALSLALGVLTGVLVARLLGPTGRGELAALILWPTALVFLAAMGINQAIVFYTGRKAFSLPELWTASTVIGLGQSALALLAGLIIIPTALRHYPHNVQILSLAVMTISPFIILGGYPANLLQGRLELGSFSLIQLAAPSVYALSLAILTLLHRVNLRNVVICQVIASVLAFVFGYSLLLRRVELRLSWHPGACLGLLRFGWKTELGNVTNYVNRSVDQLILSVFVPPHDLGLYVVAATVALALNFLPQAAGIVALAAGSNANVTDATTVIGRSFRASLCWLLGGYAAVFIAAPLLITRVFGPAYSGSILPCRILLPGAVAVGINQVLYDGARALGDPALASYSEGFAALVTIASLCVLIPWLGFVGAAIASTLAYVSSLCVALGLYKSRIGVKPSQLFFVRSG